MIQWIAAGLIVAATASGAQSCDTKGGEGFGRGDNNSGLPGACQVDTRGIRQEGAFVTDVVTARCNTDPAKAPRSHTLEAWLEYSSNDGATYKRYESRLGFGVPDDEEGVSVQIAGRCHDGKWRSAWKAYGVNSVGKFFSPPEPDRDFFPTRVECR